MAKKEKTVELKPKVDKISDEHLKDLQKVVNEVNGLQFKVGQLESQKHNVLHELVLSQNKIIEMQDMFSTEYGSFDINIADGTINWDGDEK
tara:strand:- start:1440 stop:1712 length:273 start_codon:yes stop_codon:yes gene_type:complete